jgi:hypothetical protein
LDKYIHPHRFPFFQKEGGLEGRVINTAINWFTIVYKFMYSLTTSLYKYSSFLKEEYLVTIGFSLQSCGI